MKLNREELLSKLLLIRSGVSKKDIVDLATHVMFTGEELVSHNGFVCVRCPLKTDFKCFVDSGMLYDLLFRISSEQVELLIKGKELRVVSTGTKAGLSIICDDKIEGDISKLTVDKKKWRPLPEDFMEGISLCAFSVSEDVYSGVLNSVSVSSDNIYSSDDLRISHYKMKAKMFTPFLLPLAAVVELVKHKVTKYFVDKDSSWAYFGADNGLIFGARCLFDAFPDADQFFDVKGVSVVFPKKMTKELDVVSAIISDVKDRDKVMKIELDTNKVTCSAKQEKGWVENVTEMKYKGKKVFFSTNPVFFYQILCKSSGVVIGERQALFTHGSFRHVMSLIIQEEK
jgi:hypothetical protein